MNFNSIDFLIFFPVVCLCYYIIPLKIRYLFLLVCSYFFYMCWNPRYALLLFTSTAITWLSGLLLEHAGTISEEKKREHTRKVVVALSFVSNLAILFFFKYFNFTVDILTRMFAGIGITVHMPALDVILPVGISFYTFQALSYTMDVYRGEIYAEKNLLKYALFVSFFPQLVAGPIERSKNLLKQIGKVHRFDVEKVRSGLLLMLYGFFQKVVVSEYMAIVVNNVYDNYTKRSGFQLLLASICFAFQIYCDFGGYSNIAIGAARVMGFDLMENFNAPYFSQSVAEFWRRWHISLSTWFRDYLYIPLGGNRKGKLRKQINCMIVFLVSGLWHGASMHYVVWGGINGLYQVIGGLLMPVWKKLNTVFHIDEELFSHKLLKTIITFGLVDVSWVFFRASFRQALGILKRIALFWNTSWFTWGGNLKAMGLDRKTVWVLVIALVLLFLGDVCKYCKFNLNAFILKQGLWLRWCIYLLAIFGILIYGIYGPAYDASEFIYFQF